jgi:hypothetical protein
VLKCLHYAVHHKQLQKGESAEWQIHHDSSLFSPNCVAILAKHSIPQVR